jgi:hypothetical protein
MGNHIHLMAVLETDTGRERRIASEKQGSVPNL